MSYPSTLSPWFVVQRLTSKTSDCRAMEYFTATDEGENGMFQEDADEAMLFMSLHSAARVAASEGAEVRVLTSKKEADDFGRA